MSCHLMNRSALGRMLGSIIDLSDAGAMDVERRYKLYSRAAVKNVLIAESSKALSIGIVFRATTCALLSLMIASDVIVTVVDGSGSAVCPNSLTMRLESQDTDRWVTFDGCLPLVTASFKLALARARNVSVLGGLDASVVWTQWGTGCWAPRTNSVGSALTH